MIHEKHLDRKEMRKHNIDIVLASTAISTSSVLVSTDSIYDDIHRFYPIFRYTNWLIEAGRSANEMPSDG